jgi:cell division protein FtsW (lipid II flippase)
MFDTINGLPIHPLVVHAVVVLLPLSIVGVLALVIRPVWRHRYGVLVAACALIATGLIPVATSSGESLEKHVGNPGEHAELGDQLIWFAIPVLIAAVALVLVDRGLTDRFAKRPVAGAVVSVVAVLAAVAAGVQVVRVGDSGARAAWGDQMSGQAQGR